MGWSRHFKNKINNIIIIFLNDYWFESKEKKKQVSKRYLDAWVRIFTVRQFMQNKLEIKSSKICKHILKLYHLNGTKQPTSLICRSYAIDAYWKNASNAVNVPIPGNKITASVRRCAQVKWYTPWIPFIEICITKKK